MHYHIILTERCNSKCRYCYEKSMNEFDNGLDEKWSFDLETPADSVVNVLELKKFLKKQDTLIFYGGEPLVMIDKLKEIMDNVDCRFCMQTNGKLLNALPEKYLNKYGINNVRVYDLPFAWRLMYTVTGSSEIGILSTLIIGFSINLGASFANSSFASLTAFSISVLECP